MPLNLTTSDGEFTPYLKYNAKAGRFYIRPQGATEDVEVDRPRLAFDMANIKTGWIFYPEGGSPEKVWDPSNMQMAPKPPGPKKFKRGFEVMVFGNDEVPGAGKLGLREFGSTANNVITAILAMYDQYEQDALANSDKVPFFVCTGVKPVSGAYGTNYEPRFELKGWIERWKVAAFDEHLERAGSAPHATGMHQNGNGNGHASGYGTPSQPIGMDPPRHHRDLDDTIPF